MYPRKPLPGCCPSGGNTCEYAVEGGPALRLTSSGTAAALAVSSVELAVSSVTAAAHALQELQHLGPQVGDCVEIAGLAVTAAMLLCPLDAD